MSPVEKWQQRLAEGNHRRQTLSLNDLVPLDGGGGGGPSSWHGTTRRKA